MVIYEFKLYTQATVYVNNVIFFLENFNFLSLSLFVDFQKIKRKTIRLIDMSRSISTVWSSDNSSKRGFRYLLQQITAYVLYNMLVTIKFYVYSPITSVKMEITALP